jgi:RNA polymerase sigma-70 factor (ECF subfamily)
MKGRALSRSKHVTGFVDIDSRLTDRFLTGDTTAFDALVERHKNRIYGLVCRISNDPDWAEDITADVFVEVFRSLPRFESRAKFTTWLHRVAMNVCLESIRRRKSHKHVSEVQLDEQLGLPAASDPAESVMSKDLAARITNAMQLLPETHRAAIAMFYLEELNCAEIGQILGIPRGTAKTRIFYATKILRDRLRSEGVLPPPRQESK